MPARPWQGQNIKRHDPVEQTHKVMPTICPQIAETGNDMGRLVNLVVYLTDVRHRESVCRTLGGCVPSAPG